MCARNVAVALNGDIELHAIHAFADPLHMRAKEIDQLSPDLFKGNSPTVFSAANSLKTWSDSGRYGRHTRIGKDIPRPTFWVDISSIQRPASPIPNDSSLYGVQNCDFQARGGPLFLLALRPWRRERPIRSAAELLVQRE